MKITTIDIDLAKNVFQINGVDERGERMPVGSPTQIAREFNQHFSGQPVSAQTVRKWLHAETVPTQPKLLALSTAWLRVSAQWLRYGSVDKQEQFSGRVFSAQM